MEVKEQTWLQSGESGVILQSYCANTSLLTPEDTNFSLWRSAPTVLGTFQPFHFRVLSSEIFPRGWGEVDCAHRSVSDGPRIHWRSSAMSLPGMHFAGLIKARFLGKTGIQERDVSHIHSAYIAQLPSLPCLGLSPVMMLLQILGIKLQLTSVRLDLIQPRVILNIPLVSPSPSMGSPRII